MTKNKRDPSTVPWGTPESTGQPLILHHQWLLSSFCLLRHKAGKDERGEILLEDTVMR